MSPLCPLFPSPSLPLSTHRVSVVVVFVAVVVVFVVVVVVVFVVVVVVYDDKHI